MDPQTPLRGASVRAIMVFAQNCSETAAWYGRVFGAGEPVADGAFVYLMVGDVELGFHPADEKQNPPGASTVVYWSVDGVGAARAALLDAGAAPHRGPLRVTDDRTICQLRDPFGNVFGLDGPP